MTKAYEFKINMPDYLNGLPNSANINITDMVNIYGVSKSVIHTRINEERTSIEGHKIPEPVFKAGAFARNAKKWQWNLGEVRADIAKKLIAQEKDK